MKKNMIFLVALSAGLFFGAAQAAQSAQGASTENVVTADELYTAINTAAKLENANSETVNSAWRTKLEKQKSLSPDEAAHLVEKAATLKSSGDTDKVTPLVLEVIKNNVFKGDVNPAVVTSENGKNFLKDSIVTKPLKRKVQDNPGKTAGIALLTLGAIVGGVYTLNKHFRFFGAKAKDATPAAATTQEAVLAY